MEASQHGPARWLSERLVTLLTKPPESSDTVQTDDAYDKNSKNRLRRIEGQIRGILAMMDDGRPCTDVVVQLSAIRSAIDRLMVQVVGNQMERCLYADIASCKDIDETLETTLKLLLQAR